MFEAEGLAQEKAEPLAHAQGTVDTFALHLKGWRAALQQPDPLAYLEAQIMQQLTAPIRLLRWAIVQPDSETDCFFCEGAYLRN